MVDSKPGAGLRLAFVATLAAVAMFGSQTKVHASLVIEASVDGGAYYQLAVDPTSSNPSTFFSGQLGPTGTVGSGGIFAVTGLFGVSNAPGTPTYAELVSSDTKIQNLTESTHSLTIRIGSDDFSQPIAPPGLTMESAIGGTVSSQGDATPNTLTFQSYVNSDNSLTGTSGFTTGPQSPAINLQPSSYDSGLAFAPINSLSGPFSMVQYYTITLGTGSQFGWQAHTSLTPVPEPATIGLMLSILPMIGVVALKRRRAKA